MKKGSAKIKLGPIILISNYSNITTPDPTKSNMGGVVQRMWVAPISYFDTIGAPETVMAAVGDLAKITDTHTFLTGKGFHKFYLTKNKGGVKAEPAGEEDGKSLDYKFEGFTPGGDKAKRQMMAMLNNEKCIVLIEEAADMSIVNQIGSAELYASFNNSYTSGGTNKDLRGHTISVEAPTTYAFVYEGTITEHP